MVPVIADLLRVEYEANLRDHQVMRLRLEDTHRLFWYDIISDNLSNACVHFCVLRNEYALLNTDHMMIDRIDTSIIDNLSEMILVRSKTQKTKARAEIKHLIRCAALKGEVFGWWQNHH